MSWEIESGKGIIFYNDHVICVSFAGNMYAYTLDLVSRAWLLHSTVIERKTITELRYIPRDYRPVLKDTIGEYRYIWCNTFSERVTSDFPKLFRVPRTFGRFVKDVKPDSASVSSLNGLIDKFKQMWIFLHARDMRDLYHVISSCLFNLEMSQEIGNRIQGSEWIEIDFSVI